MNLFDTMERTLQVGTPKTSAEVATKPIWPAEFRNSVDAALHLGTPPASQSTSVPSNGPRFIE